MERNTGTCAHCGQHFFRLTDATPIVNRSDGKSFHVALFFGPAPRLSPSGGSFVNEAVCTFAYAHDRISPKTQHIRVVVLRASGTHKEVLRQIEEVTDKLAELLESGKKPRSGYTFDRGRLIPGMPK